MLSCDLSWKNTVVQLMNHYSQRTNGATVTEKGCSVVWDYKDSDPVLIIYIKGIWSITSKRFNRFIKNIFR